MSSTRKIGYFIMFVGIVLLTVCLSNLSVKIVSQGYLMDSFLKNQKEMSKELAGKIADYNSKVDFKKTGIVDPFNSEDIQLEDNKLIGADEIFGYLEIPKINFKKPIYLGASYEHLAKGVAQLDYTSIPVGGVSTRSVICGHRGWYGDIMLLKVGQLYSNDVVYVHEHKRTLTYKVIGREYINPSQWEKLKPVVGKDMLTILSCDPMYPPFTSRILINCVRVEEKSAGNSTSHRKDSRESSAVTGRQADFNSKAIDYLVVALSLISWAVLAVCVRGFVRDLKKYRK
ncbi:class C sortase [uncultured Finegoldia sp.]|uniref:class C sortase n=1 Tax=uncultured Finegoldia sp. TaxID=328009 RepID=UPI00260F62E6|nr:class C sortase [uncultured Finegoldia sp.]